jgi:uncharacterized protein YdeI (YjbR/CyaY-like superfamily)
VAVELPELVVRDATSWRTWLDEHHAEPDGVWLVLARKGTSKPTSLTYDEALEEALCYGWIDGQAGREELVAVALASNPKARKMFEALNSQNQYAILYRLRTAKRADTRARRLELFVAMLARGETIYPQRKQ